jgi:hypothetical protein
LKFSKFVVWACLLALFHSAPSLASSPSAAVPLDSWVYPVLDKLAGLGLIDDSLQGSRPYSRSEAARQTAVACERFTAGSVPMVAELLRRLEAEFSDELSAAAGTVGPERLRQINARAGRGRPSVL